MENQFYDQILSVLKPLYQEQGFHNTQDTPDIWMNGKKAFRVTYDQDKKMFFLFGADTAEGEGVSFRELSGWLFDESHTAKDAEAVANDFAETVRKELGLTAAAAKTKDKIAMPSKNAKGTTAGVEAFAKRFLDLFPQYKDAYRENVAAYGTFLYEDFFRRTAAVQLREMANAPKPNARLLTKFFSLLDDMYQNGDSAVGNVVMFTILGGAFGGDLAKFESLQEYYDSCSYIKQNGRTMILVIKGNKKYQEACK